jgi:protein SCO1/2
MSKTALIMVIALLSAPLAPFPCAAEDALAAKSPKSQEMVARDYFTDLPLVTHQGKEVRFFSDVLENRIVLISGICTTCKGVASGQAQVLSQLQIMLGDSLGRDVFIVSITVDPTTDDPETVRQYAEDLGSGPGWIFLSGPPQNVSRVTAKLGLDLDDLQSGRSAYLLGNVKTTLWMKAPAHALAADLYRQIQRLIQDVGESESG